MSYYVRHAVADALPHSFYEVRLAQIYEKLRRSCPATTIFNRVNHYNKLPRRSQISNAIVAKNIPLEATYYYYDLKEHLNYFPREMLLHYKFGDLAHLLDQPSFCKTRPICDQNANAVLCKLDKLRHFNWTTDFLKFSEKKKACVWRGNLNNEARVRLVKKFSNNTKHNIGHIGAPVDGALPKEFLSIGGQLAYRYIVSIEGFDVATNLKSILASQSVCFMPKPKVESWFMESQLLPDVHYVELRDDFADLEEKADYYNRHENEALTIIRAANAHANQFLDLKSEEQISILVLQKYFESLGQLPESPFTHLFW